MKGKKSDSDVRYFHHRAERKKTQGKQNWVMSMTVFPHANFKNPPS